MSPSRWDTRSHLHGQRLRLNRKLEWVQEKISLPFPQPPPHTIQKPHHPHRTADHVSFHPIYQVTGHKHTMYRMHNTLNTYHVTHRPSTLHSHASVPHTHTHTWPECVSLRSTCVTSYTSHPSIHFSHLYPMLRPMYLFHTSTSCPLPQDPSPSIQAEDERHLSGHLRDAKP